MGKENERNKIRSPIIKEVVKDPVGGRIRIRWEIPDGTYPNWPKIVMERSKILSKGLKGKDENGENGNPAWSGPFLTEEKFITIYPPDENEIFPAGSQFEGENPFFK